MGLLSWLAEYIYAWNTMSPQRTLCLFSVPGSLGVRLPWVSSLLMSWTCHCIGPKPLAQLFFIEGGRKTGSCKMPLYALRKNYKIISWKFCKANARCLAHACMLQSDVHCQHVTGACHKGGCSKFNCEAGGDSSRSVTHSSQGALGHLLSSEVIFVVVA